MLSVLTRPLKSYLQREKPSWKDLDAIGGYQWLALHLPTKQSVFRLSAWCACSVSTTYSYLQMAKPGTYFCQITFRRVSKTDLTAADKIIWNFIGSRRPDTRYPIWLIDIRALSNRENKHRNSSYFRVSPRFALFIFVPSLRTFWVLKLLHPLISAPQVFDTTDPITKTVIPCW